jgi:hypothetical protein
MSVGGFGLNGIVTNGLVLNLDAANRKSFVSGSTSWFDLSGGNNTGTLTNGPTYSISDGGSISFNGSTNFISTNLVPTIGSGNITYSVWFKTTTSQTGGLIGVRSVSATQCVLVMSNSVGNTGTNLYMSCYDGSIVRSGATTKTWADGKWHHAVMVHTSTSDTLYVDGVLEKQNTSSAMNINNVQQLLVGCNPNGNTYLSGWVFNGSISNAITHNRALSATEILQNYNTLKNRYQ